MVAGRVSLSVDDMENLADFLAIHPAIVVVFGAYLVNLEMTPSCSMCCSGFGKENFVIVDKENFAVGRESSDAADKVNFVVADKESWNLY